MANSTHIPPPPNSADRALPPVEPPSAGFLIQLFVIPGVIVVVIVVVWLMFHWLAAMGNDPREYIKKLRGNSEMRWQAAVNLAGALQGEAGEEIKHDPTVAADLGRILADEIAAGDMEERPINLRIYLCRALGEFKTDAALAPLLNAASTQRDDAEIDVERAAVHGLTSLTANLKKEQPSWSDPKLVATLIAASKSDNANLRAESAFALGIVNNPEANAQLKQLLDDEHADARYNAAISLARAGDAAALPVIKEMLDPDQTLATKEELAANRAEKQRMVHVNGLRALAELAKNDQLIDLQSAVNAVNKLTNSGSPEVRGKALELQNTLTGRKSIQPEQSE
jgi:HEAT repeat protein